MGSTFILMSMVGAGYTFIAPIDFMTPYYADNIYYDRLCCGVIKCTQICCCCCYERVNDKEFRMKSVSVNGLTPTISAKTPNLDDQNSSERTGVDVPSTNSTATERTNETITTETIR